MQPIPGWLRIPIVLGTCGLLLWWEGRRPLRRTVEAKSRRVTRNLIVAALSATALQLTERAAIAPLAALTTQRRWGLLPALRLPAWAETALAVLLLDHTLYAWHVLTHRVGWLWRFHLVHHVDLDLDASTALRFHAGELVLAVVWRAGQVVLIGASPRALSVWQTLLFVSILFHHSNVRLPLTTERWLNRVIVTPRMHGIHHSRVHEETDSNWSSGLTLWDWLHCTLRLNVPQDAITIGVPAYPAPADVTLGQILTLPFRHQRPPWHLPNGEQPRRPPPPLPPTCLLA